MRFHSECGGKHRQPGHGSRGTESLRLLHPSPEGTAWNPRGQWQSGRMEGREVGCGLFRFSLYSE